MTLQEAYSALGFAKPVAERTWKARYRDLTNKYNPDLAKTEEEKEACNVKLVLLFLARDIIVKGEDSPPAEPLVSLASVVNEYEWDDLGESTDLGLPADKQKCIIVNKHPFRFRGRDLTSFSIDATFESRPSGYDFARLIAKVYIEYRLVNEWQRHHFDICTLYSDLGRLSAKSTEDNHLKLIEDGVSDLEYCTEHIRKELSIAYLKGINDFVDFRVDVPGILRSLFKQFSSFKDWKRPKPFISDNWPEPF